MAKSDKDGGTILISPPSENALDDIWERLRTHPVWGKALEVLKTPYLTSEQANDLFNLDLRPGGIFYVDAETAPVQSFRLDEVAFGDVVINNPTLAGIIDQSAPSQPSAALIERRKRRARSECWPFPDYR